MSSGIVLGERFNVVGAARRARARQVVPVPSWMRATTSQGVSRPQEEMDFLPLTPVTLAAGGTGATFGSLTALPQRPFRGERPVLNAIDTGASTDVSFNVVITPVIFVGAVMVGASRGSTPLTMFGANAFGVRLSFPPMGQGTSVEVPVALVSGTNETIVSGGIVGRAMR